MPRNIRLWRVSNGSELSEVGTSALDLESRLEDWIAANADMVDPSLLIIGRQVQTDFGGSIDLLGIDRNGDLVVLELKRDRTPRDVTAQALDYASWVVDLSRERTEEVAAAFFEDGRTLESEFSRRFQIDLPETLNGSHRILIVASDIDPSTERIVQYLHQHHGLRINAVTFQFFGTDSDGELVGRVFLVNPEEVENKARSRGDSKRKPCLSVAELRALADERGAGKLFSECYGKLQELFGSSRTTRSSVGFCNDHEGSRSVMVNLIPSGSDCDRGVAFQAYSNRLSDYYGRTAAEVDAALPSDKEPWRYASAEDRSFHGYQGFFRDLGQVKLFVEQMRER